MRNIRKKDIKEVWFYVMVFNIFLVGNTIATISHFKEFNIVGLILNLAAYISIPIAQYWFLVSVRIMQDLKDQEKEMKEYEDDYAKYRKGN